jgi:hypothetical protein
MLVFIVAVALLNIGWVMYTKDDGEMNIRKGANIISSVLFWGFVGLVISITIFYAIKT